MSAAQRPTRARKRGGSRGRAPLRLERLEPRVLLSVGTGAEPLAGLVGGPGLLTSFQTADGGAIAPLAVVYPSAIDQYVLEHINRGRADPAAEAARYGIELNEGIPSGTISNDPKQPLAFNLHLIASAYGHSEWLLEKDLFQHEGPDDNQPQDRMADAGYADPGTFGSGENIGLRGWTVPIDLVVEAANVHADLFVDEGYTDRGHRVNQMDPDFKEAGVGAIDGMWTNSGGTTFYALMVTEDFACLPDDSFLTGVAYDDLVDHNWFYDPGEGLSGVTVVAVRQSDSAEFTTVTWDSGGYTLQLAPGTYDVTASGGGLAAPIVYQDVAIGDQNVKLDFTTDVFGPHVTDVSPEVVPADSAFVQVEGTGFVVDGGPFYAPGTNCYYLMQYAADPATRHLVDEVLHEAADLGLKTVRTWGFYDGSEVDSLQYAPGSYRETTFVGLDYVVHKAGELGLRLIIPFVNYWDEYGGMRQYLDWDSPGGDSSGRDILEFYSDPDTRGWYQDHVAEVVNRVNTFTGIAYRDDPTIMAWELANEPRNGEGRGTLEPLQGWIEDMAAYVKSVDSNHLLTTGLEGFYSTDPGYGWLYDGWMCADFIANHDVPGIDFATCHVWPHNWEIPNATALDWTWFHLYDANYTLGMPLLIEEFGQQRDEEGGGTVLRDELYAGVFDLTYTEYGAGWNFWILFHDGYEGDDGNGVYYPSDTSTIGLITAAADWLNADSYPVGPAYAPVTVVDVAFDTPLDPATVTAASVALTGSGGDRHFGDANDVAITPDAITLDPDGLTVHIQIAAGLPDDLYRITLDGTSSLTDLDGNPLDGEFTDTLPSGDITPGGDFVAEFAVETFAAPGQLAIDTAALELGRLNRDAPGGKSLGIDGLDPNGNPPHRLYAVQIGDDPDAGWLCLEDTGEAHRGAYALGTEPEWHVAGTWAGIRVRGLEPGTDYTFRVVAQNAEGVETAPVQAGPFETSVAGDVNVSGLATALDYSYARVAVLTGESLDGTWHWSLDADDSGTLDDADLGIIQAAILGPPPAQQSSVATSQAAAAAAWLSTRSSVSAGNSLGRGDAAQTPAARLTTLWTLATRSEPWQPPGDEDGDVGPLPISVG